MCKKRQGTWKKPWANPSHDISEAKKAHRAVLLLFAGEEREREEAIPLFTTYSLCFLL
jgi:hypothetical protein